MWLKIIEKVDNDEDDELKIMENYTGSIPQVGQIVGFVDARTGRTENIFKVVNVRWVTTNDYENYTFTCMIYVKKYDTLR